MDEQSSINPLYEYSAFKNNKIFISGTITYEPWEQSKVLKAYDRGWRDGSKPSTMRSGAFFWHADTFGQNTV